MNAKLGLYGANFFLFLFLLTPPAALLARSLTLEESMLLAEQKAYEVKHSEATLETAQAQEGQSWSYLGPRVVAEGNALWLTGSKLVGTKRTSGEEVPNQVLTGSIGIVQPLIGLAAIIMKVKADILATQVTEIALEQSKRNSRFKAAELYIQLQKAQHLLNVSKQSLHVVQKQFSDAKVMHRVGKISRVDVLRFESAFNESRSNYTQAQIATQMAQVALAELLGLSREENFQVKDLTQSHWEEQKKKLPETHSVLEISQKNNSAIISNQKKKEVADYYKLAAELDYTPTLNFIAKIERDFKAKDMFDKNNNLIYRKADVQDKISYGFNLQWTLWDWGARNHKIDETRVAVKKLDVAIEESQSQLRVAVSQAILQLQQSLEVLSPALTQVQLAEEVFKLTKLKFDNGSASTTDLILAERDQTGARGNLANVRGNLDIAWFQLQKVMGIKPSVKGQE